MYGIFTYIYPTNVPNVGNIPCMDDLGSSPTISPGFFVTFDLYAATPWRHWEDHRSGGRGLGGGGQRLQAPGSMGQT